MDSKGTVNRVILVGRLGQDPDIRYSPNGVAVARFSLATNERIKAGENNWEDRTEWHRVVAFGKLAEVCGNFLAKGRLVFVEGSIRGNQWEDAQGQKRFSVDIVARDIQMLGSGEGQSQSQGQYQGQPQGQPQGQYQGQPQGQYQGGHQGQEQRQAGSGGRPAMEELPPHHGAPDDDIPF